MDWKIIRSLLAVLYTLYFNAESAVYDAQVVVVRKYFKSMTWLAPVFEVEKVEVVKEVGVPEFKYLWHCQSGSWKGIVNPVFESALDRLQVELNMGHGLKNGKIGKIDLIKMLRSMNEVYNSERECYTSLIGLRDAKYLIEVFFPMYLG